jgi:tetratricopeptide (TPR) repeat protein
MDPSSPTSDPRQQARELLSTGRAVDAEALLKANLELGTADAETNALLGAALSMNGKTAESITYLERAIGLDPTKASYYFNRGAVAERTGVSKRAMDCYRRALELDPQYSRAGEALQRLYRSGQTTIPQTPAVAGQYAPSEPSAGLTSIQPQKTDLAGNPVAYAPVYGAAPQEWYPSPQPPSVYGAPGAMPGPYTAAYAFSGGDYALAPQIVKSARFVNIFSESCFR